MSPVQSDVWFSVPAGFNAADVPALAGLRDEAHWFLDKILRNHAAYRHDRDDGGEGWACVSLQTIRTFIHPRHANAVKVALIDAGIIETDGQYTPSAWDPEGRGKSLGYRVTVAAMAGGTRMVKCNKPTLANKIHRHRVVFEGQPVDPEYLDAVNSYLWNKLRELRIDRQSAAAVIDGLPRAPRNDGFRRAMAMMTVDTIAEGQLDATICSYGRFHSPATRLISEARPCLSVGGLPLANLDVKNSQLVFLLLAMLRDLQINPKALRCRFLHHTGTTRGVGGGRRVGGVGVGVVGLGGVGVGGGDVVGFAGRVLSGTLYDVLMGDVADGADRRAFKARFFRDLLFGDDAQRYAKDSPIAKAFAKRFPTAAAYIHRQKATDYRMLARRMQREESDLMIRTVCDRLRVRHPEAAVITVHDSIMTTPPHVADVLNVMGGAFRDLGVEPTIAVTKPEAA